MTGLLALCELIDRLNASVGKAVGWLLLVTTAVSAFNAVLRKAADFSSNGLLEIQWYLFAAVFLLGAGYTLQQNAHVRIDVVSSRFSEKTRAWVDILGHLLFTLPLIGFVLVAGWQFLAESYVVNEYSADTGGLVRWPAKALIVLGFALLGLQVISEVLKKMIFLRGNSA